MRRRAAQGPHWRLGWGARRSGRPRIPRLGRESRSIHLCLGVLIEGKPRTAPRTLEGRALVWLFSASFVAVIAVLALRYLPAPPLSPDGWGYWELAQTVFRGDFYRINTMRQFYVETPYSNSFPFGWPIVFAVADALTGLGPRAGALASMLCWVAAALLAEWIARVRFGRPWCGLVAAALLLGAPAFVEEIAGAGNDPAATLLALAIAAILTRVRPIDAAAGFAIGLISGLALLVRFDWGPPAVLLAGVVWLCGRSWGATGAYLAGVLIAASPWIGFSLEHFGAAFASDNRTVVLAADPTVYATDWRPGPVPTLFDEPLRYFIKVVAFLRRPPSAFTYTLLSAPLLLLVAAGLAALAWTRRVEARAWLSGVHRRAAAPGDAGARLFLFACIYLSFLPVGAATGYAEKRYLLPPMTCALLLGLIWAQGWIERALRPAASTPRLRFLAADARALLLLGLAACLAAGIAIWRTPPLAGPRGTPTLAAADFAPELACLKRLPDRPGALFVGDNRLAAQFGAVTGWPTVFEPNNLLRETAAGPLAPEYAARFFARARIGAIVVTRPEFRARAESYGALREIPGCTAPVFAATPRPGS